jgi:ubiquinone/menaquinone biosynthesis C-methylase UbiE
MPVQQTVSRSPSGLKFAGSHPDSLRGDAGQRTVLHVGCGPADPKNLQERFRNHNWREIRVDLDPNVEPHIIASITDLRVIADASVDAVWSSHNLEHVSGHEVPRALAEFLRVLKPGGFALITLPDLEQAAHYVVEDKLDEVIYISPAGPVTALDCIYGMGRLIEAAGPLMAHRTGFTATTLRKHLERAGFASVRTWFSPFAIWAEAAKAPSHARN